MVLRMLGRPSSLRPSIGRDQILFFEPDRGTNPGGGPAPAPAPAPGLPPGSTPAADDRQNLQGLLARHNNDTMQVVATLLAENHQLRDERRQLRSQVPAQGAVVLAGEDATRWQQYQQLGAIDALTQQLQSAQATQAELASLRRQAVLSDVQTASGYKASVLAKLPGADGLTFEVRDVTADGKTSRAAFVKDKDGKEHPLADYAKSTWADFLPSLTANTQAAPAGTTFVPQNPGGGAPADALSQHMQRFQQQRDQAPNPLAPAAPPQRTALG